MNDWKPRIGYCYWFLAREQGVSYGNVLSYSDYVERVHAAPADAYVIPTFWQARSINALPLHVKAAVVREVHLEMQRREEANAARPA